MEHNANSNYALNGKRMLCSAILIFVTILVISCFYSYALRLLRRYCRHRGRQRQNRTHHRSSLSAPTSPLTVSSGGLDVSVIKSIPTFIYSAGHHKRLECAVCLSEFEDKDCVCVLLKCKHAFHFDCIDMWFHSHSTCPLCRAPVETVIPDIPPQLPEQAIAAVTETAGLEEKEINNRSPTPALVGIAVEMPAAEERLRDLQNAGSGGVSARGSRFKSPGHRILSLRRIWSI
ncbi:hypothetical protein SLA2020_164320 [Shorea laevis]